MFRNHSGSEGRKVSFAKIQALGNDFIWILDIGIHLEELVHHVPAMAERRFGIGADGVIFWQEIREDSIQIFFYNKDGSEAELCGNALRALSISGRDMGLFQGGGVVKFELAGRLYPVELPSSGARCAAGLGYDQPDPSTEEAELVRTALRERSLKGGFIRIPNPHIVVFIPRRMNRADLQEDACFLASAIPGDSNVGFVYAESSNLLAVDVWERGAGWTKACGSGAAAAWSIAYHQGIAANAARVRQQGGSLDVTRRDDGRTWIEGDAALVYRGSIELGVMG